MKYPEEEKMANLWAPVDISKEGEIVQSELRIPIIHEDISGTIIEIGLALYPVPALSPETSTGLAICPYSSGISQTDLSIGDSNQWSLKLEGDLDITKGIGIIARPSQELKVLSDISNINAVETKGSFNIELRYRALEDESIALIDVLDSFRLEAKTLFLKLGLRINEANKPDFFSEIGLEGGKILISTSSSDSFLKSILPSDGLQTDIDFSIGWSKLRGVYISGASGNASTGFEKNVPINKTVGPLNLQSLYSMVKANDEGISIIFGLGVGFRFGPITITVDKIGIVAELKTLKEAPEGLLGYLDLKFRFKSPDGLGITLDSNGIKGGGFIWKNQEEYAGIIDLDIRGFSVQALALLDTKDRSFLFAIFSQFRTPIQLRSRMEDY